MKYIAFAVICLIVLTCSACTPDPNESLIQGTWSIVNEAGDGSSSVIKFFEWEFRNGYFYRTQEIGPLNTIQAQGRYRILESEEDVIVLELFDIQGERFSYGNAPVEIKIEIDREQDRIRIVNILFERVAP